MGKTTKIWLIIASSLILVGCIIFGGVMTLFKWDFTKLQTAKFETKQYDIHENYKNVSIVTDTADIVVAPCKNEKHAVVCYEQKNAKHLVSVKDDTLVIEVADTRKWYERLEMTFGKPNITVYIPQGDYGSLSINSSTGDVEISKEFKFERMDILESTGNVSIHASASDAVKIKTSTSNIRLQNASAGSLELSVSTGEIMVSNVICEGDANMNVSTGKTDLTDMACKNLISSGNTGDISLNHVIAAEKLSIKRSTGDVRFSGSDAAEIFVQTDTGNVLGVLLTDKVFITQTDTGRVNVPKTVNGGKCEISTDTGDIRIDVIP